MKNIKLSAAQQKVMDIAHEEIRQARECDTVEEWFEKYKSAFYGNITSKEFKMQNENSWNAVYVENYEMNKKGIVLTMCNSKTLEKLSQLGLIEILHDSCGKAYGVDKIKILDV